MASTKSERRIDQLAHPKGFAPGFLEDRRSVYWIDRYPPRPGTDGTTVFVLSKRQQELCQAKRLHQNYNGDRPHPVWPVSNAARSAEASERLAFLAQHRSVNPFYLPEASVYTRIKDSALKYSATGRLEQLSIPKPHKMWANSDDTYREGDFSAPIRTLPPAALTGNCSARVEVLAEAKVLPSAYQQEKSVQWPVTETAKNAVATIRLQQLARPKSGRLINDDYDPYKVSAAAKNTRPTPRITELCIPLPRKVRQKKN